MKKFLLVFFSLAVCSSAYSQNWWKSGIVGEGPSVKKTLDLDAFHALSLTFSGDVYLKQGSSQKVEVEGQQNIIDNIETEVDNGYWKIKFDRPVRKHEKLKVYITVPKLTKAYVSGSGDIIGQSTFTGLEDLDLGISGSGNIKFGAEAKSIVSKISGSGDLDLSGAAETMEMRISGSGNISAYNLKTQSCSVYISGSGDCEISVEENLEVRVSGSGDVAYKGRPRINTKITGSGDLISRS